MRLRSLDSGRLFSANTAFATAPLTRLYSGGFAEPFSPPLRASLRARRSSLRRAPQGPSRPLTRGRGDTPAPARLHLLWRSRASASNAALLKEHTLSRPRTSVILRYTPFQSVLPQQFFCRRFACAPALPRPYRSASVRVWRQQIPTAGPRGVQFAYACGEHGRFRVRFTPPPNPSRAFLRSAGLTGSASPIPPRCYAPGPAPPYRPKAKSRVTSPSDSLLSGCARKNGRWLVVPF